jgi:hypothetical protein
MTGLLVGEENVNPFQNFIHVLDLQPKGQVKSKQVQRKIQNKIQIKLTSII